MSELTPLCDFPAIVCRVKSMVDKSIRIELDLPENETPTLSKLHGLQRDDKVLRVVIYDDDEFQTVIRKTNP